MPYKDPAKKKEHDLKYQKSWILNKLQERKEAGVCAVSGCGKDAEGKKYCPHHRMLHNEEEKRRRARIKQKGN